MTAPEGINKQRQCWLQSAVPSEAKLEGDSKEDMNTIRLHPVALEGEQHSFPPGRVKPCVYAQVIAHKNSMQTDARVAPLEQIAQL